MILNSLQAESALYLVHEREDSQIQVDSKTSQLELFDIPDANLIIRSSDSVDFRVHKPVLAMASPVFKDLFSLPQPSDSESDDDLPVVQLPEDSELLHSLVSIIYPVPTVIPKSYEKVLYLLVTCQRKLTVNYKVLHLLAACQKYDMVSAQSFVRAEVSRGGFPAPTGVEAFPAYAIASGKKLIPEMENAARQTLKHPMTFEILGEGLRQFETWALRDLANFRKRCRDNLVACFESFSKLDQPAFNIWTPCTDDSYSTSSGKTGYSPAWLIELFQKHLNDSHEAFSKPLFNPRSIRGEYLSALKAHLSSLNCVSCTKVHSLNGEAFCKALEDRLTQALSEVCAFLKSFRGTMGNLNKSYLGMRDLNSEIITHVESRN
jgi:BTB/POZ domain